MTPPATGSARTDTDSLVVRLLAELGSGDGVTRQEARDELARIGERAVPRLTLMLGSESWRERWEAAKTLGAIADPDAAGPLAAALLDENSGVRWVAAEALIALGRDGLAPLLRTLVSRPLDPGLRSAAHHVLRSAQDRETAMIVDPVVRALDSFAANGELILAAGVALNRLRDAD